MSKDTYFQTLTDAVFGIAKIIDDGKIVLVKSGVAAEDGWPADIYNRGHIAYDTTHSFDWEINTYKGKPTRKYFHASIARLSSGTYEVVSYVL